MRVISGSARGTKLYSLEGENTRPTLDRVKESLFNIISSSIYDSTVLDLFSGSGSIGIEFASRGANKVIVCDSSKDAVDIIRKNVDKTNLSTKIEIQFTDSLKYLEKCKNCKFDFIFIDPPYKSDLVKKSIKLIYSNNLLTENGIVIIETDEEDRIIKEIQEYEENIYGIRKYGRAKLIFLRKG